MTAASDKSPAMPLATLRSATANIPQRVNAAGERLRRNGERALASLFRPAVTPASLVIVTILAAFFGLFFWHWFLAGPLALDFEDWPKERAYLDLLRTALVERTIPLHMDASLQMTQRFLAIPETMLAPHILFLPWLSNAQFIQFQVSLLFLAGLAGCTALAWRQRWSPFALLAFLAVFSINGFIVTRIGIGHFMWTGYYLYPWMLLVTLRWLDAPESVRTRLAVGWTIGALFLVGSFHLAVWWLIFLAVLTLAQPQRLLWGFGTVALISGALTAFRILPAALTFGSVERKFGSGFPNLEVLWRGFATASGYDTSPIPIPNGSLGWWEFDHFVGAGVLLAVVGLAFWPKVLTTSTNPSVPQLPRGLLLTGVGIITALALSQVYAPIASLPFPLLNAERWSMRFISVAFFVLLFLAAERVSRDGLHWPVWVQVFVLLFLGHCVYELWQHAQLWRPLTLEAGHGPSSYWENSATFTAHPINFPRERAYKVAVAASWAVSLGALAASFVWWRHSSRSVPVDS
ncbi:MAG TPA: hypothetical protein VIS99_06735 [Terrimicrobiaceae bacterium]